MIASDTEKFPNIVLNLIIENNINKRICYLIIYKTFNLNSLIKIFHRSK